MIDFRFLARSLQIQIYIYTRSTRTLTPSPVPSPTTGIAGLASKLGRAYLIASYTTP